MIYAMFALIVLTFTVAGYLLRMRVKAVKNGEVRLSHFRLNNGEMPPGMVQASRNYSNLFEVPVFFFAAATLAVALHMETTSMLIASWLFVVARVVHSWIHVTYNNVMHRLAAFMAGNLMVVLLWILIVVEYAKRSA